MMKVSNPLMLLAEKGFQPVSIDIGDEYFHNGIFVFNITKMTQYIENNKNVVMIGDIAVKEYRDEGFHIDEEYLKFSDLTRPVILAEICPGIYNLIDGHHRIEKAHRIGIEKIRAYKLKPIQHMQFLTTGQAYSSYIEYWNSKIKDGFIPA